MVVESKRLPNVYHEDAITLDVWRMDNGVALTFSDLRGRCYAGAQITSAEWDQIVLYIREQFKNESS